MTSTATWKVNIALDRADPGSLSIHERLRELTAILANGIHRLRSIPPVSPECRQIPAGSSPKDLDPGARSCPYVAVSTTKKRGDE